ncbi:WecB/TagA/CpsF family glycosyltransferase [Clostridium cellulovorans]|uniref:N-acetylglucosaminyldiphosphoundecaprenol N-acetyl-beta-D-mannosaminyltransferase n=1 Tax=Clostridium cellulovorans (strain ATCC 35296 / DSM 3052 / OCM 3 / 743B) TaxID=573061 RepID=D9SMZ3_CLOC7|nr:WecB/TagA/CpsF family glycosyltransferase [Clostridium cellulovorans]ADL51859.1 glycosyl transferase, WecB/TagA/CpsF family [Clostridium cellulovorans 743B]
MASDLLGYKIYSKSMDHLIHEVMVSENKTHIISGNPEVLTSGLKEEELFNNFTDKNSIIIPDGIGIVISARLTKVPVEGKIPGIEVLDKILREFETKNKSVYLLGATEDTVTKAVAKLKKKYPTLIVAGYHNGFFDLNNCNDIIENIKASNAEAIFVAMGAPRQERFIIKYMDILPCKIFMGVGGSFDIIAGNLKRAPKWMISLGLEWLYRVSKEPFRIKRLGVIPKFIIKAVISNRK